MKKSSEGLSFAQTDILLTGKKVWTRLEDVHTFLSKRGIPKRYLDSRLGQFSQTIRESFNPNSSYFVTGPAGSGKTHLICAMLRETSLGTSSLFLTGEELLWKIKDSFNKPSDPTQDSIITQLIETEILAIDDLFMERVTDWSKTMLSHIINSRYNDMKVTYISSNLSISALTEIDERIASRLAQMCIVIKMEGSDKRTAYPD